MENEDYEYSIASRLAYDYYYNNQDDELTQRTLDTYITGYTLDRELSDENHIVVQRPDGSAIVAYRGTDPTNPNDLMADLLILGGAYKDAVDLQGTRFNKADEYYRNTITKYSDVDVTGHSLGGSMGIAIGSLYGAKTVVFNPGASPFELAGRTQLPQHNAKIYKTEALDLVSMSERLYSDIVTVPMRERSFIPFLGLQSHDIKHFLPEQNMLPLDLSAPDVIIPSISPKPTGIEQKEIKKEIKEEQGYIQTICELSPELAPSICYKDKPKLKIKKLI
jgi:hypothetical protein